jgi:hypothetical protein
MATTTASRIAALTLLLIVPGGLSAQQPAPSPQNVLQDPTHEMTTASVPGLTAAGSLCGISSDAAYGTSSANPIKVGGGAAYAGAREVRYLSALRGPSGQGLHFKRSGSSRGPDGTILDIYQVDYPGIERPLVLYLDAYRWAPPLAPSGWLCGTAMSLEPPGPDPFETAAQLMTVAVGLGAQPLDPISLDADGSKLHGVVFDHIRLVALAARAATEAGRTLDPRSLPQDMRQPRLVVIAFPLTCEGRSIAPASVTISDARGNSPPVMTGGDAVTATPGFTPPAGSIRVAYRTNNLIEGAKAVVQYSEPCAGTKTVELPSRMERGRPLKSVPGVAPAGVAPAAGTVVRVQIIPDGNGVPQFPAYVGGPVELTDAAIAAAREWRIELPKINGAPVVQPITLGVSFRASAP